MIDLRSDTVTKPTPAMREAIANAPVGDDVYHDDPTVNELEARVAGLLGKDDAMFVPSGTMSNQVAVRIQTEPGDSVIIEEEAHIGVHELGGAAHHSGVTLRRIAGTRGVFGADAVRDLVPVPHPALPSHLLDPFTLVCVENTHNAAGGTVWPIDAIRDVTRTAAELGLRRHLDGARIWNASVASGVGVDEYASHFDTVSVCFSKGLGAPVGSALVGDRETIDRARRFKHLFGGGMRQAGLIAAGALYAIDHHRGRVADDHANARAFAEGLAQVDGCSIDLSSVQTNIVNFDVDDAAAVVDAAGDNGVLMLVNRPGQVRAVFSLAVENTQVREAIEVTAEAIRASLR